MFFRTGCASGASFILYTLYVFRTGCASGSSFIRYTLYVVLYTLLGAHQIARLLRAHSKSELQLLSLPLLLRDDELVLSGDETSWARLGELMEERCALTTLLGGGSGAGEQLSGSGKRSLRGKFARKYLEKNKLPTLEELRAQEYYLV